MPIAYETAVKTLRDNILAGKFLALSTTEPRIKAVSGSYNITEPSTSSTTYRRVQLGSASTFSDTYDSDTQKTTVKNNTAIYFPECVVDSTHTDWGTLGYFAIFQYVDSVEPLYVGSLTSAISPNNAEIPTVRAGYLELSLLPDNN